MYSALSSSLTSLRAEMGVRVPPGNSVEISFCIHGLPSSHSLPGPTSLLEHLSGLVGMSAMLAAEVTW